MERAASVRALINERSNSTSPARTVTINLPCGDCGSLEVWFADAEIGKVLLGQPSLTPLEPEYPHARAGHRESHGAGAG
jgi:hypothetical protein